MTLPTPVKEQQSTLEALAGGYRYGWHDEDEAASNAHRGLDEDVVRNISMLKNEPEWMLRKRLKALRIFQNKPMPTWGADLNAIDFDNIKYFVRSSDKVSSTWDDVPENIKDTYDKLGIPEAERNRLVSGVAAQYESEVIYHQIREDLSKLGVIFLDTDTALREHEELFREYFASVIPAGDNKFSALNTACWSGGCLTETAMIRTENGLESIKDIQIGAKIFSLDTNLIIQEDTVVNKVSSGKKEVFTFRAGGRTIEATGNHRFLTIGRSDTRLNSAGKKLYAEWKPLADLENGDVIAIPKKMPDTGRPKELPEYQDYIKNKSRLKVGPAPSETTSDLMWLLGIYLGDGHISNLSRKNGNINIALPTGHKDFIRLETIRLFEEIFGYRNPILLKNAIQIGCHALAQWIYDIGFDGNAHTKRIPKWVWSLPIEQKISLLAGLIDSDGSTEQSSKTISLELCNKELVNDFKMLAIDCGLYSDGKIRERTREATFFEKEERYIYSGTSYSCRISGEINKIPCRSPHRRKVLDSLPKYTFDKYNSVTGFHFSSLSNSEVGFAPIKDKKSIGVGETYDIQTKNNHNFIANGIVAHNSFIYVPPGVHVDIPLQAYFRINTENMGQFERTLIIVDEGASVHYVEGCSAPLYTTDSLHSAVVEIVVKKNAHCRYTTIQNWSTNVYNLVTKRAKAEAGATMEWVDANIGCIAEGSLVYTPTGPRKIEDMEVGDEVISYNTETQEMCFSKVKGKKFSGVRPVLEIKSGIRKIRVTENHPFYAWKYYPDNPVKLGRYKLDWVRADELRGKVLLPRSMPDFGIPFSLEKPSLTTAINSTNQWAPEWAFTRTRKSVLRDETGELLVDEDLAWLLGLYIGDGYTRVAHAKNGRYRYANVTFSVPVDDRAHDRLVKVMANLCPNLEYTIRADKVLVTWHSVELAELLFLNGFAGKARTKRIPDWVHALPTVSRASFIAGYVDSDGCWQKGTRNFSIKSVSRDLVEDTGALLTSLGISARIHKEKDGYHQIMEQEKKHYDGAYVIYFTPNDLIIDRVTPKLREQINGQTIIKEYFRTVGRSNISVPEALEVRDVTITQQEEKERTWDLEIEETENFVCEGFLVHNSSVTEKYPAVWLMGDGARGETLSLAFAGAGQHQDTGAKMLHMAPNTSSNIVSKSVSMGGGRTSYRGLVRIQPGATNSRSTVRCDALLMDDESRSDTYPYVDVREDNVSMGHEATVSRIGEDQLFYLMSRGLSETESMAMVVRGFIEPVAKELPMEYALELNRLVELQMVGAVG